MVVLLLTAGEIPARAASPVRLRRVPYVMPAVPAQGGTMVNLDIFGLPVDDDRDPAGAQKNPNRSGKARRGTEVNPPRFLPCAICGRSTWPRWACDCCGQEVCIECCGVYVTRPVPNTCLTRDFPVCKTCTKEESNGHE